ncbi:hypothetical protein WALSEDRAFT_62940 [Wallemia mellicola CBS 633.66]|uniref:RecQ-mediated genome instability protein 1 n=2 Tax=Wallemia mellicola TaxID=1708541 RepID=A0A4T0MZV5_9BASI|nr:hypothetical protein WALSEDRAFT_62940 [Wallemia mellicola CBS 633.66]TIB72161.1 hypothetical protein E3Q24_01843 [Wallemia mellicola]EIM22922.1 hypothetical protein WALSEDRAFT_62940 [Wallemia mellicola CBS 633.66]TIB77007.1 hypothetical protein E3Q23_01470 [Wallemia mellicola]TIB85711.1 hypothetical protein E3Q21_01866 [Wallemia mellicola]TIB88868.1 hypothetical protein E3Q20_01859 [Wallemia mellicola]|eukprot:XP_006956968.1 hypothetical protein WALSEDRAFT_62940 [Wallemia mellicola CBS 633.66]
MEIKHLYKNNSIDDEWLDSCIDYLRSDMGITNNQELLKQTQLQFINSDLADSTTGGLPSNILELHNKCIFPTPSKGILLQVQSITDVGISSLSLKNNKEQKHTIKLVLSDGRMSVNAFEYAPIPNLSISTTAIGSKVIVKNVQVLHGTLLLTPQSLAFKGGRVEELENNREKIIDNILDKRLGIKPETVQSPAKPRNAEVQRTSNDVIEIDSD